jgi:hypothetical protein
MTRSPRLRLRGDSTAWWAAVLALAAAWLTASCATRGPAPTPLPDAPDALQARRPSPEPFRAAIEGRVRSGKRKGRFRAGLGAQPPGLRLDVFHPASGATLLSVGVTEERLRAVWPQEGACLDEPASREALGWLLGFRVEPSELLPLLTGHLYRDQSFRPDSVTYPPLAVAVEGGPPPPSSRDRLLVSGVDVVSGAAYEAELSADRDGLALRGRRVDSGGDEVVVEYPRWNAGAPGGAGYPRVIQLRAPARKLSVDLKIKERAAGGPPQSVLLPALPSGCRTVRPGEPGVDSPLLWPDAGGDAP